VDLEGFSFQLVAVFFARRFELVAVISRASAELGVTTVVPAVPRGLVGDDREQNNQKRRACALLFALRVITCPLHLLPTIVGDGDDRAGLTVLALLGPLSLGITSLVRTTNLRCFGHFCRCTPGF